MLREIVLAASVLALARAQIPSLGFCPDYVPMANFNMDRFMGRWYEAERYFQLSEVVSRCVLSNYTKGSDGKYRVSNEVTNRFTGIKRTLEGEIKATASKADEGKLQVKYTTVPLTPETKYSVLETDYENYAVLWSCSGIGPVHTQNAWIMTRVRLPAGEILQKAYGVLDKYKISKTFFVKTDQDECAYLESLPQLPAQNDEVEETSPSKTAKKPDAPEVVVQMRKAEIAAEAMKEKPVPAEALPQPPKKENVEKLVAPVVQLPELILKKAEEAGNEEKIDDGIAERVAEKVAAKVAAKLSKIREKTAAQTEEKKSGI